MRPPFEDVNGPNGPQAVLRNVLNGALRRLDPYLELAGLDLFCPLRVTVEEPDAHLVLAEHKCRSADRRPPYRPLIGLPPGRLVLAARHALSPAGGPA